MMDDNYLISGAIRLSCRKEQKGESIEIEVNDKVPGAFRLGVMLDNLDVFMNSGLFLNITTNNNGDSGNIPLASSNRHPDWYFFDICDVRPGDNLSISCHCEYPGHNTVTIGGIVFDVFKGSSVQLASPSPLACKPAIHSFTSLFCAL